MLATDQCFKSILEKVIVFSHVEFAFGGKVMGPGDLDSTMHVNAYLAEPVIAFYTFHLCQVAHFASLT